MSINFFGSITNNTKRASLKSALFAQLIFLHELGHYIYD